jgi:hypothetical protein
LVVLAIHCAILPTHELTKLGMVLLVKGGAGTGHFHQ